MNENTRCHFCGHKANVHERGRVCLASRCTCIELVPTWTLQQIQDAFVFAFTLKRDERELLWPDLAKELGDTDAAS